jgi:hypothetical protein
MEVASNSKGSFCILAVRSNVHRQPQTVVASVRSLGWPRHFAAEKHDCLFRCHSASLKYD